MPYLTPNTLPDSFVCRQLIIPDDPEWIEIVSGALSELTKSYNFELFGDVTPDQCSEAYAEMFWLYTRGFVCLLGSIIPYATTDAPTGTLPCDGSNFNRVDYPRLYSALDAVYIVDADTFKTPDLRGRAVIGSGAGDDLTARAVGDTGGEETHVLTIDELAIHGHTTNDHTHTDSGHVHGYNYPTLNLDLEAPGVPDLFAAGNPPIPLTTSVGYAAISSENVTVNDSGDDQPHNNMQPYHTLRYCIVAS